MEREGLFDDLVAVLHRAALDPAGWQDFSDNLELAFGGSKISLHGVDAGTGSIFLSATSGFAPEFFRPYADYYHSINPFMQASVAIPHGMARVSPQDLPDEFLIQTEFYNDWLRPQEDLFSAVALKSRPAGSRSLVLAMNIRRRDRASFEPELVNLLNRLEPHISHAFHVGEVVAALSHRANLPPDAAMQASVEGGVIETDERRMVLWADAGALMLQGGLLRISILGQLSFADEQVQAWAERICVADERRQPVSAGLPQQVRIGRDWTVRHLRFQGAVSSPTFNRGSRDKSSLGNHHVFVISRVGPSQPLLQVVSRLYGLSGAEAAVAMAIAEGLSTAEIAMARQVSIHTVRNQIRVVLQKMEARTRSDVARMLVQATGSRSS
ncbi:hypothetical protein JJJ17_17440 [Paracoccus caeni]|uniref:HTH luxR-type domain-containing protein n=1 Tax=Paracoccus caeni TaxID=657651 RepID=A0A934SHS7_9RHOB|nr:LuxR C-terminal-related transcriptional regulator [Paracoccus caeni]MBK4217719.1 hypothetical protein [Paracoccus caeni]